MIRIETTGTVDSRGFLIPDVPVNLKNKEKVRLIIEVEDSSQPELSQKEKLMKLFAKARKAGVFSDINDPVQWQRDRRDEWE